MNSHKHLKRCDASPYGAPCVCPDAPHTLRFLGDNVTLTRSSLRVLDSRTPAAKIRREMRRRARIERDTVR